MRAYIRRKGIVKEYPCETCQIPCYKQYARAFCSDRCRFMAYVEKTNSCWIWNGTRNRRGYGKLSFKDNRSAIASRVSYELFKGPLQDNLYVCHSCDNPPCVNPDHLWHGTHMENTIDMIDKGRQHSKITPSIVMKLRNLYDQGYSNGKLAEMFGLTTGTISNIIYRKSWKHV